jgi:hypothetical protein
MWINFVDRRVTQRCATLQARDSRKVIGKRSHRLSLSKSPARFHYFPGFHPTASNSALILRAKE